MCTDYEATVTKWYALLWHGDKPVHNDYQCIGG